MIPSKYFFAWSAFLLSGVVHLAYGQDDLLAALDLADKTTFIPVENKNLNMLLEVAGSLHEHSTNEQRVSFELHWDTPLAKNIHFVLANRFDSFFSPALHSDRSVNSFKEAYLAYSVTPRLLLDIGRINTRYGVAFGYNPTDFLGQGTVRAVTSADPETLRNNRLGNAMVRWQYLWDKAALTVVWSPKLRENRSPSSTSLDWRASNPSQRFLLVGSYQLTDNLHPQWLLLKEQGHSAQFGFNLSHVLSHSTLFYVEWAGGRQFDNEEVPLLPQSEKKHWRNRLAYGMTWSSESQLTLRVEGHYKGSADNPRALALFPNASAENENATAQRQYALSPRRAVLFQAYWKDIIDGYDLNAIWQRDLQQKRNIEFVELRRHMGPMDAALQWQNTIARNNQLNREQRWQLSFSYFF